MIADAMLADEVGQKKDNLALQEPNELVVEEPKVANEADAIVAHHLVQGKSLVT
jgi:hypothetical protein